MNGLANVVNTQSGSSIVLHFYPFDSPNYAIPIAPDLFVSIFPPPSGLPLFPGEDEGDQLACIMEVIDLPPESLLERSRHVERFFYESMAQACHAVTALSEGEAVKGLPCGKATSPTAQPIGEGSTTVASKGSGQSGTATGIGSGRVHEYVPRYCTIRVLPSGEPQLLPGLSKKGGHVRGRPGSLPIEKVLAIWSGNKRLRQHRFRAPTNSGRL
ncbi:unnamed protein product, partial [Protopolystoma xenopodis]